MNQSYFDCLISLEEFFNRWIIFFFFFFTSIHSSIRIIEMFDALLKRIMKETIN